MLSNVEEIIKRTERKNVINQNPESSWASIVAKINKTGSNDLTTDRPVSQNTPKRRRPDQKLDTPKTVFKGRKLTSGTAATTNHGLGCPVKIGAVNLDSKSGSNRVPSRVSQYAHLTKSIYVSRLQNTVSIDQLMAYMKDKITTLNEKDVALRLLVKRDQPLDQLTFISYRLLCTKELYSMLMESSFWPEHVMIGEFIDKPSDKKMKLSDFVPQKQQSDQPSVQQNLLTEETSTKNISIDTSTLMEVQTNTENELELVTESQVKA